MSALYLASRKDEGVYQGCDAFTFDIFSSDGGNALIDTFVFTIGVYSSATVFTEFDLIATQVLVTDPAVTSTIPFLFFTEDVAGDACGQTGLGTFANPLVAAKRCGSLNTMPVDITSVDAMQLILNVASPGAGPGGVDIPTVFDLDLRIGAITKTVPEPGTLALLGGGLAAFGFLSRRKRGRKA